MDKTETPVFQTGKADLAGVPFECVVHVGNVALCYVLVVRMSHLSDWLV